MPSDLCLRLRYIQAKPQDPYWAPMHPTRRGLGVQRVALVHVSFFLEP